MRIPRLNALLIPGFVGLGLVSGLLREAVLAYYLGASLDMDIFRVAIGLPLILSDSLAVSFVSVLIPILFSEQKERDAGYNQVMWASILMACCVFAAGALTMPWQARLLAPGISGPQAETLILAGRLCWLMLLFTLLSLPLRAIMSAQNILWPGASAQFIRSAVFVLGLVVIAALFSRPEVFWITIVAAISGFAVFIVHVVATPGVDRRAALMTMRHAPSMREVRSIMGVLLVVFATQLLWSGGRVLDRSVASTMQPGLLTSVEYSYAILMAVGALIGTSANIMLARAMHESG